MTALDGLPGIAFGVAFAIPVGFGLGLFVMALLGVDVVEAVRTMRRPHACKCGEE